VLGGSAAPLNRICAPLTIFVLLAISRDINAVVWSRVGDQVAGPGSRLAELARYLQSVGGSLVRPNMKSHDALLRFQRPRRRLQTQDGAFVLLGQSTVEHFTVGGLFKGFG
jgi:hypothetical protein